MRLLFSFFLMTVLATSVSATNMDSSFQPSKDNTHIGQNPGTPDGRNGGEDMSTAVIITNLPFRDTGNTSDNINDYDATCPVGASMSPDVVYSYTPPFEDAIRVDLCGSGYDTKTYILDAQFNVIDCNDDAYFDDVCGMYVSVIRDAHLMAGIEYFIVIDGYSGDSGDYNLVITTTSIPEPCPIICDGVPEGEPALGPDYEDAYNGGCSAPDFNFPFLDLSGDANGHLVFCGTSGWFDLHGADYYDTDWFSVIIGETGVVQWYLDAALGTYGFYMGPPDCEEMAVLGILEAGPCALASMTIEGNPGDVVWLCITPREYTPPMGFDGYEYNYTTYFYGLNSGVVPTANLSLDRIKSLYR